MKTLLGATLLLLLGSIVCSAADTQKHVVSGSIYNLLKPQITSSDKDAHSLIDLNSAKMTVDDAEDFIDKILADATAQSTTGSKFMFDSSTTYVIHIVKFQDNTHTTASDQNWYVYNNSDLSHFGSFSFKTKEDLFEGARLYGRTSVCLIAVFLNEDNAQPPYVRPNVVYNITETKQQVQLVSDFQSLLAIAFGGAGANQVGFYFVANQSLKFSSSSINIESMIAPLLTATSKQFATPDKTPIVGVDMNGIPNPLELSISNKTYQIQLAKGKNDLADLESAIAAITSLKPMVTATLQPGTPGAPSTLAVSVQGWSGATSLSLTEIAPTRDQAPILQSTVKQTSLGTQTFQNQGGSWITLGVSVPLTSYNDVSYQASTSTSGPTVQPTNATRQNVYASVGFYYPTVDPLQTQFRWLPHPIIGVPFTTNPLRKSMAGLAIGLNWVEPFASAVFNVEKVHPANATSSTQLQNHLVVKGAFGINIPLSTAVKLLASKSNNSNNSSTQSVNSTTNSTSTSH